MKKGDEEPFIRRQAVLDIWRESYYDAMTRTFSMLMQRKHPREWDTFQAIYKAEHERLWHVAYDESNAAADALTAQKAEIEFVDGSPGGTVDLGEADFSKNL